MFNIILYEPEIPPNTGNIIRLCANIGAALYLIKPLGFALDDKQLRRAGLDYAEYASVVILNNWAECKERFDNKRIFAVSTRGVTRYSEVLYQAGDCFLFGPETRGLPATVLNELDAGQRIRIPMLPERRSLNLSNAAAIIAYEAWRQVGFSGGR